MLQYLGTLPGATALGLIWGLMAIGVYITYKILDLADLTVDGSLCTGGAVVAMLMVNGWNVWAALLVAVIAGLLCGLLTGLFHTLLGIPAILAGILTQLILWSVNLTIIGKSNQGLPARVYDVLIASMNISRALLVLGIFTVVIIGFLYWFFGTELGSSVRATGNNLNMSRSQGINTSFNKVLGLALSNGMVALAGAMLTQYQGVADISMGRGAIVIGLAAVIIGEAVVSKLSSNLIVRLLGVVLGSIIYWFVFQTVIFIGLNADLLKMLSALVVAVFLGVPYLKRTYFPGKSGKKVKKNKNGGNTDA